MGKFQARINCKENLSSISYDRYLYYHMIMNWSIQVSNFLIPSPAPTHDFLTDTNTLLGLAVAGHQLQNGVVINHNDIDILIDVRQKQRQSFGFGNV